MTDAAKAEALRIFGEEMGARVVNAAALFGPTAMDDVLEVVAELRAELDETAHLKALKAGFQERGKPGEALGEWTRREIAERKARGEGPPWNLGPTDPTLLARQIRTAEMNAELMAGEVLRLRAGIRKALIDYGAADGNSHMRMMDDLEHLLRKTESLQSAPSVK